MDEKTRLQNASQIFLYCTGGVRCERASLFLNSLLSLQDRQDDENNNNNNYGGDDDNGKATSTGSRRRRPEIYQLHGGIQRYLECTVGGAADSAPAPSPITTDNSHVVSIKQSTKTDQAKEHDDPHEDDDELSQQQQQQQQQQICYFKGKNFVFDQRRLDPVFYKPQHDAKGHVDKSNSDHDGIVGKCLVCSKPHDDFDNGHAPAENKEARCWNCRILILVCNTCRPTVSCWKPKQECDNDNHNNNNNNLPRMYCAGLEKPCFHKPPVQIILSKQEKRKDE
jgi:hypothetical protein